MINLICEWGAPRCIQNATEQAHASAEIGARYAKWQVFRPERLASKYAKRYWDKDLGGKPSQLGTFKLAGGLSEDEWRELFETCRGYGVEPFATPFELEAVDLLERVGISAYKIASGDVNYAGLLKRVAETGKRVFLSTGAASEEEIGQAVGWLEGCEVIPMACDLVYPCPPESANLARAIPRLGEWGRCIGYSDHTRDVITGAVAVSLGATVLEKHVTLDTDGEAPDDKMALSVDQAKMYYSFAERAATLVAEVKGDPQDRARVGARRSAYAAEPLPAGHVLRGNGDVAWLRPCPPGAIEPTQELAGRALLKPVSAGDRIEKGNLV